jgi:hypothetical protein
VPSCTVNPKPRPNHRQYVDVLRRLSPAQRLQKAFELSSFTKALFIEGLKRRFPDLSDIERHRLMLRRLSKCHNQNY